jgi:hypothetical protein
MIQISTISFKIRKKLQILLLLIQKQPIKIKLIT